MRFVETPVFTREVTEILSDDEYRGLQLALVFRPEQGSLIPKSSGLRKLRWKKGGGGKRGGLRVIYFWDKQGDIIYMLLFTRRVSRRISPRRSSGS